MKAIAPVSYIDLPNDDAILVESLIEYLYRATYTLHGRLSFQTFQPFHVSAVAYHAAMYFIACRFQAPGLRSVALTNYHSCLREKNFDIWHLVKLAPSICNLCPANDESLRQPLVARITTDFRLGLRMFDIYNPLRRAHRTVNDNDAAWIRSGIAEKMRTIAASHPSFAAALAAELSGCSGVQAPMLPWSATLGCHRCNPHRGMESEQAWCASCYNRLTEGDWADSFDDRDDPTNQSQLPWYCVDGNVRR